MVKWDRRKTPWRQGHFLTNEAAVELDLITPENIEKEIAILISHDCDLTQDPKNEPYVEIIIGNRVEKLNGIYTNAKNPRIFHLAATENGLAKNFELIAIHKKVVPKVRLLAYAPNTTISISSNDKTVFQRWLAARYCRSAFPDKFNEYLKEITGLSKRLIKILEPLGNHLIAVYFDLEEDVGSADVPYRLSIYLLYSTVDDPLAAEHAAQDAAELILKEFRERCFDPERNDWKYIELLDCDPISDRAMTYAQSQQLIKWNIDYLSFRGESLGQPLKGEK
jgi:hypothetical protein